MKKIISILVFSIAVFTSCYDDADDQEPKVNIFAFYETIDNPGVKKPDVGAKVFFYYQLGKEDFTDLIYSGDGIFIKDDYIIKPDEQYTIGEKGEVSFIPQDMEVRATIVIESNYYKGNIAMTSFSFTKNGVGFSKVFKTA